LLETVSPVVTEYIWRKLKILVHSIGSGIFCDGQLLICGDILGIFQAFTPKFVKKYANVGEIIKNAFVQYIKEVKKGEFPTGKHVYHIKDEIDDLKNYLMNLSVSKV